MAVTLTFRDERSPEQRAAEIAVPDSDGQPMSDDALSWSRRRAERAARLVDERGAMGIDRDA